MAGTSPNIDTALNIVIPTYNRPLLLERAVRSSLMLGLEDYTVVVIDDGSTVSEVMPDGKYRTSEDVVRDLEDPRIIYHRIPTNGGLGGVFETYRDRLVTGRYFTVLNDDDMFIDPEPLHKAIQLLDRDEGISFVQISLIRRSIDGKIDETIDLPYPVLSPRSFIETYIDDEPIKHTTMYGVFRTRHIFATDALRSLRLRDHGLEDAFGIDTDFLFRVATTGRVAFINQPHVLRNETLGITERFPTSFAYCYYQYVLRGLSYMRRKGTISRAYRRKFLRHWYGIMILMYDASIHSTNAEERGEERIRRHLRVPFHFYLIWEMWRNGIVSLRQDFANKLFLKTWKIAWRNKPSVFRYFYSSRRQLKPSAS